MFNCENVLCDSTVENRALDQVNLNFDAVEAVEADVSRGVDKLTKMHFVIFFRDETYQMCPRCHIHFGTEDTISLKA